MPSTKLKSICHWRECQGESVSGSVIDLQKYREKKLLKHQAGQRSGLTRFLGGLILGTLMIGVFLLGVSGQKEEGSPQTSPVVEHISSQSSQFDSPLLLFIGLALAGLGLWGSSKNTRIEATAPKKRIKRQRSQRSKKRQRFFVTD